MHLIFNTFHEITSCLMSNVYMNTYKHYLRTNAEKKESIRNLSF